LPPGIIDKLEEHEGTIDRLLDMTHKEIGELVHNSKFGSKILSLCQKFPHIDIDASVQPITRGILRVTLDITVAFEWTQRYSGSTESWWIWVEDNESEYIYHSEYFAIQAKQKDQPHTLTFTIPVREPLPPQYVVCAVSDRWVGSDIRVPVSFQHLILPDRHPPHTELLDLNPLPREALNNPLFERLFKFTHFNPLQTQIFHVLYHTDTNVLVGSPTGSGKTVTAELAILRMLNCSGQGAKAVYVAPLKALARERLKDWRKKFGEALGLSVLELTGDVTPDTMALKRADIIVTTPEKWDGISRGWKDRSYVTCVKVMIIDEIHLLGEERGPVLEVIVSRMKYISAHTGAHIRVLGLSTALANPRDLADWLGIGEVGVYNFRPSVRPVPLTIYIQGFPGKHYCPRMATMNKCGNVHVPVLGWVVADR
jgi:activating signal cointegrator complex subunit 3